MLDRRGFLVGGAAMAGLAVATNLRFAPANAASRPQDFGAVGDGLADDTRAVQATIAHAFRSNLPIDGGNALFAIRGDIDITGHDRCQIQSLRLRQLNPARGRKTLHFANCDQIKIDRLQIDVGQAGAIGYPNDTGGLWIDGGTGHDIRNVEVFGRGKNSLIAIWNTRDSVYSDLRAHDAAFDSPGAKDDMLVGITMIRNSDCTLRSPIVSNLSGNAKAKFRSRFTRGIALGGNVRVQIVDAKVTSVEQGIDITGSDGNRQCTVLRAHCVDCGSVGIKLANSAVDCRVIDSIAERCGLMGFLASGPSEPGLRYKTSNCEFVRCTAIDPGYNGFRDSAPHAGFRVERNEYDPTYPMGIRFIDCRAFDRQPVKTMEYGFYSHVQPSSGAIPNQLVDCVSEGHIRGARFGDWS